MLYEIEWNSTAFFYGLLLLTGMLMNMDFEVLRELVTETLAVNGRGSRDAVLDLDHRENRNVSVACRALLVPSLCCPQMNMNLKT